MFAFVGQWGHAAAAILFGALAAFMIGRARRDHHSRMMTYAFATTAAWALFAAIQGPDSRPALLGEIVRNVSWLYVMYAMWREGLGNRRTFSIVSLYGVLAGTSVAQFGVDLLPNIYGGSPRLLNAIFFTSIMLRMMVAIGALVLVHNLYTAATPDARAKIRLPMIALSVMWVYDLNLYTTSYLLRDWSSELFSLRGIVMVLIAPVFGLGVQRSDRMAIQLSRTATFQTLGLVAIGSYLAVMISVASALHFIGGEYARAIQVGFVFSTSVAALVLLPSKRFRAWFRVKLSKHLFQHRYDYRAEWVRFTDTIGRPDADAAPLDSRIVKAIADIIDAPGGLLLVPDEGGSLSPQARWNWPSVDAPSLAAPAETARFFAETGRIVELDVLRRAADDAEDEARMIPQWMIAEPRAWAIVPLVHFDRLAGVVVLERPATNRTLDWEDFDLLKVAGRQVASYLAEASGQQALSNVRQFDEFNRRFAFIMHDIKNLVSQLSLVTRNAERHADKPEFRVDMIATLQNSTARMNDLLARLSQHNKVEAKDPRPCEIGALAGRIAEAKRIAHPIVIGGDLRLLAMADEPRLEAALSHIVQNAIDASPATEPVSITIKLVEQTVQIDVIDQGVGMTSSFIRSELFKPFSSTKQGGFGIGAFEARSIIIAMGGQMTVQSKTGEGSRFTILLPVATDSAAHIIPTQVLVA